MTASPPAPRLVIGIDLGTTNSLAAIRAGRGARVLRDKDGEPLIPSIVCFHPDGRTIVGREAKALRLSFPERTVFSAKRLIGRAGTEVDREARLLPYRVHRGERDLARKLLTAAPPHAWAEVWDRIGHLARRTVAVNLDKKRSLMLMLMAVESAVQVGKAA